MGSLVVNTSAFEVDAGKEKHLWWNKAAPGKAVWSANAIPLPTPSLLTDGGAGTQETQLEVTRMWRRYTVAKKKYESPEVEHEIHCQVKNLGTEKAKFSVYFSAVW